MKCGFTPFAAMFRWSALADPADRLLPATDERDTHKWTVSRSNVLVASAMVTRFSSFDCFSMVWQLESFPRSVPRIPWWTDEL